MKTRQRKLWMQLISLPQRKCWRLDPEWGCWQSIWSRSIGISRHLTWIRNPLSFLKRSFQHMLMTFISRISLIMKPRSLVWWLSVIFRTTFPHNFFSGFGKKEIGLIRLCVWCRKKWPIEFVPIMATRPMAFSAYFCRPTTKWSICSLYLRELSGHRQKCNQVWSD